MPACSARSRPRPAPPCPLCTVHKGPGKGVLAITSLQARDHVPQHPHAPCASWIVCVCVCVCVCVGGRGMGGLLARAAPAPSGSPGLGARGTPCVCVCVCVCVCTQGNPGRSAPAVGCPLRGVLDRDVNSLGLHAEG